MSDYIVYDDEHATPPGPAPLTQARVIERLEARGFGYKVDPDGDVGGMWDDHLFYFFVLGASDEYLQVRGRWSRTVAVGEVAALLEAVNAWNTDKLWPKCYVRVDGTDVGVYAEHVVDYEHGVTDEQLDLHLACGISTGLQLFTHLDELYPREAAESRDRIAALRAAQS